MMMFPPSLSLGQRHTLPVHVGPPALSRCGGQNQKKSKTVSKPPEIDQSYCVCDGNRFIRDYDIQQETIQGYLFR